MSSDASNTNISAAAEHSLGRANFIALTDQDSSDRRERLAQISAQIDEEKLEVVRVGFVDTHGIVRVRPIEARLFAQAARNGVAFTTALFAMDSANSIFQNVFSADGGFGREEMGGAGDMLAVPDLSTFRVLPWAHKSGWVLSDASTCLKNSGCPTMTPSMPVMCAASRNSRQRMVGVIAVTSSSDIAL